MKTIEKVSQNIDFVNFPATIYTPLTLCSIYRAPHFFCRFEQRLRSPGGGSPGDMPPHRNPRSGDRCRGRAPSTSQDTPPCVAGSGGICSTSTIIAEVLDGTNSSSMFSRVQYLAIGIISRAVKFNVQRYINIRGVVWWTVCDCVACNTKMRMKNVKIIIQKYLFL